MFSRPLALATPGALLLTAALFSAPAPIAGAAAMPPAQPISQTPGTAHAGPCGRVSSPRRYRHVIWIWMENHSYGTIIGARQAPYINSLAAKCGLATNYHNISHPSLPNYIAATSGLGYAQLRRFTPDCNPVPRCSTAARSIFAQGETWRAYQESMPAACHRTDSGEYAVRHNPPPYYTRLAGCARFDVPYPRLATDLARSHLPAFSFITPNLISDMHDGTIADGDRWLARNLPAILASPQYRSGSTVIFLTWDEGEGGTAQRCAASTTDVGCHVATIVISPSTRPGTRSARLFNHYSLLGTTEQLLRLPRLGRAHSFPTMTSAFNL